MNQPIAVFCSDVHFSHRCPIARTAEDSWYDAMARAWYDVVSIAERYGNLPIVIAGDVFDKPMQPPELVNFVIEIFSTAPNEIYSIPGQHDLPYHDRNQIYRSAYWTLFLAGRMHHLATPTRIPEGLVLHPFPWGVDITPPVKGDDGLLHVAVVHAYCWQEGCTYPGADVEGHADAFRGKLKGYDFAVFGDNHKGFLNGRLLNCGTLMRRKQDERMYVPQVGVLYSDGKIITIGLNVGGDKFIDPVDESLKLQNSSDSLDDFLSVLATLQEDELNFREMLMQRIEAVDCADAVRGLVLASIGQDE